MIRFDEALEDDFLDSGNDDSAQTAGSLSALQRLIHAAFADVEASGEISLQAAASEEADPDSKPRPASERMRVRKHWSEYSTAELERGVAALTLLSVRSWKFHLPAYMNAALTQLSAPIWETGLPGAVLFNLTCSLENPIWTRRLMTRFTALDARQHGAVRAFLEYVVAHPCQEPVRGLDAARALRSYWDRNRPLGNGVDGLLVDLPVPIRGASSPRLASLRLGTPNRAVVATRMQRSVTRG